MLETTQRVYAGREVILFSYNGELGFKRRKGERETHIEWNKKQKGRVHGVKEWKQRGRLKNPQN